jgi:hypothetical protein
MSLWKLNHILTCWSIAVTCQDPSKESSANTGHKFCLLSFHLYFMLTCCSTETVLEICLFTYLWSWYGALQLGRVHLIIAKTSCLLSQNTSCASLQDTWKGNVQASSGKLRLGGWRNGAKTWKMEASNMWSVPVPMYSTRLISIPCYMHSLHTFKVAPYQMQTVVAISHLWQHFSSAKHSNVI